MGGPVTEMGLRGQEEFERDFRGPRRVVYEKVRFVVRGYA